MAISTREQRIRRAARRQGLTLRLSRRRDPRALDYGRCYLVDTGGRVILDADDLDAVERYLRGG